MPLGMNRDTGKPEEFLDHLRQSVRDILTTPLGTRVHRRDYGSMLPSLVDRPMNADLTANLIAGIADAMNKWEPRVRVERIEIVDVSPGWMVLNLKAVLIQDGTPLQIDNLVIR